MITTSTCVALIALALAVTGIFGPTVLKWLLQIAASADPQGAVTIYIIVVIMLVWTLISLLCSVKGLRNNKKFRSVMRWIRFAWGCISIIMAAIVIAHGPLAIAANAWKSFMSNNPKVFGAIRIAGYIIAAGSIFFLIGNGLHSHSLADDE